MKLIIVRHGRTIENDAGIIQGHLPGTLNDEGLAQAQRVGLALADESIDVIYSSDLRRAKQTMEAIVRHHPSVEPILLESLREKYWGDLQGTKKEDRGPSVVLDPAHATVDDGETVDELYERAAAVRAQLEHEHGETDQTVLLVSHSSFLQAFVACLRGVTLAQMHDDGYARLSNTSITRASFDAAENDDKTKRVWTIEAYNNTDHLEG